MSLTHKTDCTRMKCHWHLCLWWRNAMLESIWSLNVNLQAKVSRGKEKEYSMVHTHREERERKREREKLIFGSISPFTFAQPKCRTHGAWINILSSHCVLAQCHCSVPNWWHPPSILTLVHTLSLLATFKPTKFSTHHFSSSINSFNLIAFWEWSAIQSAMQAFVF